MFHYLFTNDLRISKLEQALKNAGYCFLNDSVPSASEDKNENNNMNTLGFYFNLTHSSNCAKESASGKTRKVVLNFIEKFQFPNPRTKASLDETVQDSITLAPMRTIVKILYIMKMQNANDAYLSKDEITNFIFYNNKIAKNSKPDILDLINDLKAYRTTQKFPDFIETNQSNKLWNQEERQIREMMKILTWSGCVEENAKGFFINEDELSRDNKADLFEILTYTHFWNPDIQKSFDENKIDYQKYMDIEIIKESIKLPEIRYQTGLESKFCRNRILFGAPGTGKSFTLNKERKELLGDDNEIDYERVTFHPDYSYANFVGTYKPVPCKDSKGEDAITYEYVPGSFMRIYVEALKNGRTDDVKPFLLIVEEINRANVAAVFGDIFQLLDRDDDEVSEYPIQASEDIKKYLAKELGGTPDKYTKIKLPDNMFIWSTMNSADQGVFPMDTAFKRRWDFTYLGIDDSEKNLIGKTVVLGEGSTKHRIEWNKLRKAINKFLAKNKVNEDKQLGPYFIPKRIVTPTNRNEIDQEAFISTFKNKVIMYLFEDAAKQKRSILFEGCFDNSSRYSEICKEFDIKGIGIFNSEIQNAAEPTDVSIASESEESTAKENDE